MSKNILLNWLKIYTLGLPLPHEEIVDFINLFVLKPKQKDVMLGLLSLEYGGCISYSDFAQKIGREHEIRNIATLIGKNPLPVIVPCHRVIKKNGQIGNYVFGNAIKTELIEFENKKRKKISKQTVDVILDFYNNEADFLVGTAGFEPATN